SHALESCQATVDPNVVSENQVLSAELAAHRALVESLRDLTATEGDESAAAAWGGMLKLASSLEQEDSSSSPFPDDLFGAPFDASDAPPLPPPTPLDAPIK